MRDISAAYFEKVLKELQCLYRQTDIAKVPSAIVDTMAALIPSDAAGLNVVYPDFRVDVVHNAPHLNQEIAKRAWALGAFIHQHPLQNYYERTHESEPLRMSDVLSQRDFHCLDIYQEFFKHVSAEHQLAVYLQPTADFKIVLNLNDSRRDFSDRDKMLLRHIAPHLLQAYNNAREISGFRQKAQRSERGASVHRQGYLYLSFDLTIREASELCQNLLKRYFHDFSPHSSGLPESLRRWILEQTSERVGETVKPRPMVVHKGEQRLTLRLASDDEGYVLLLSEQPVPSSAQALACLGLGKRETEVLFWMSQGKTNPEIATILGLSVRTVHKHNENIFRKLDVETRNAAMVLALETLGS